MAGNVAKRPDGRWRARYRDELNNEHSRHFDRKVDAQQWLDHVTTSVVTGTYVDPRAGRITFSDFYGEWSGRQLWVHSTRVNCDRAVKTAQFVDMPIKSIRRSHVETWVKAISTTLAPGTVKTRFRVIRSVFRAALVDRVIAVDPTLGVVLPRRRRAEAAMRVPTVSDVGRLLAHADGTAVSRRSGFRAFVALCAFAGLRLGEASGVQAGDIDFKLGQLRVTRQVQRERREIVIRAPKYQSERVVYLSDELLSILREHIEQHLPGDAARSRWLFTNVGDPLVGHQVNWLWESTRGEAGLPAVKLHDLRHFFASGLIAEGCDVVTVQRALGHASATTTLDTYSHLWPTAEDRTRAASSRLAQAALAAVATPPAP